MNIEELVNGLLARKLFVATAESCTGGSLAAAITSVPGSSGCFGYGVVSYSNQAKEQILKVDQAILNKYGAVSSETALAMAENLGKISGADLTISITGIAGPDGGTPQKPVGLVYIGLMRKNGIAKSFGYHFGGNREDVRRQTVEAALDILSSCLNG